MIAKVSLTALAFYWISRQINLQDIATSVSQVSVYLIVAALIVFNLSKMVGAVRLHHVLRTSLIPLTARENLKLYYKGMFYNLFLPGGIGGDGYKIFYLTKTVDMSWQQIFRPVFWDRFSGAIAILLLGIFMLVLHPSVSQFPNIRDMLAIALVFTVICFQLLTHYFFPAFHTISVSSMALAFLVQILQAGMAVIIFSGMNVRADQLKDYILVFFLSSLATIIPVTVGGSGIRELVFITAAAYTSVEQEKAIAFSLIFYAISAVSAIAGGFIGDRKRVRTSEVFDSER